MARRCVSTTSSAATAKIDLQRSINSPFCENRGPKNRHLLKAACVDCGGNPKKYPPKLQEFGKITVLIRRVQVSLRVVCAALTRKTSVRNAR